MRRPHRLRLDRSRRIRNVFMPSVQTLENRQLLAASFVGTDMTTKGNWTSAGVDGYDILGGSVALPSYASVTPSGQNSTLGWGE